MQCHLCEIFTFLYKEPLDNELTEFELDHIFVGVTDECPTINSDEVLEWKALSHSELNFKMKVNPELFTVWFRKLFCEVSWEIKDFVLSINALQL